jgi:hypothetical protein
MAGQAARRRKIRMTAHPQRRRSRPRIAIASLALSAATLAAAACSSGQAGPHVAHLPGQDPAAQATGQQTGAQMDRDMISFARCMRAHGVPMSDPYHRAGHAGLSISLPGQTAANRPAFSACNHFLQPIIQFKQSHQEASAAPIMGALTAYARCMRAHDIGMLDPTPLGQLNLGHVPGMNNNFGRTSPQFRAADTACRHFLPASVHDNGTGP